MFFRVPLLQILNYELAFDLMKVSDNAILVYCGAKAMVEKMFFDDKERKFSITAVCPSVFWDSRRKLKADDFMYS